MTQVGPIRDLPWEFRNKFYSKGQRVLCGKALRHGSLGADSCPGSYLRVGEAREATVRGKGRMFW